jgi:hypothetical protein
MSEEPIDDIELEEADFSALCPGFATLDRFGMEHRREVFLIRSVEI